jgi:hypothetical protein
MDTQFQLSRGNTERISDIKVKFPNLSPLVEKAVESLKKFLIAYTMEKCPNITEITRNQAIFFLTSLLQHIPQGRCVNSENEIVLLQNTIKKVYNLRNLHVSQKRTPSPAA